MQQRQPRLGDIVDDYCPRERRVTNHVIVAMVGDDIRQTRCTTCESEHLYKHAKVPPQRRRKDAPGALYQQVLEGAPHRIVAPAGVAAEDTGSEIETVRDTDAQPDEDQVPMAVGGDQGDEPEGPVHRRLIRATLPRLGNEVPLRREPEFTIRAPLHNRPGKPGKGPKGGGHRVARPNGHAAGNRPAGKRHGGGASRQPQGAWSRSGQQGPGQHRAPGNRAGRGGKKRSR